MTTVRRDFLKLVGSASVAGSLVSPARIEHRHAGVQLAAVGGLRVSPHVYNTRERCDRVIAAISGNRQSLERT